MILQWSARQSAIQFAHSVAANVLIRLSSRSNLPVPNECHCISCEATNMTGQADFPRGKPLADHGIDGFHASVDMTMGLARLTTPSDGSTLT